MVKQAANSSAGNDSGWVEYSEPGNAHEYPARTERRVFDNAGSARQKVSRLT